MARKKKPKLPADQMWDTAARDKPGHKAGDPRGKYGFINFGNNGNNNNANAESARYFAQVCREHGAEKAVDTILGILDDGTAPHNVKLSAAKFLIERGFGKVDRKTTHTVDASENFVEALRRISSQPRVELEGDNVKEIPLIDVTPNPLANSRATPREVRDFNALFGDEDNGSSKEIHDQESPGKEENAA